jgi:hypothetical protein
MKTYIVVATAVLLTLGGCKSARISRDLTSGQIGCSPSEISITNETAGIAGTHTWTATCHGKQYVCNYHTTTGSRCTPKQSPAPQRQEPSGEETTAEQQAAKPWYQGGKQ